MRSRSSIHALPVSWQSALAAALAIATAGALAACAAPRTATVSLTAADVASSPMPDSREASPDVAATDAPSASRAAPAPAGQLACKTKDAFGVRIELYVDGSKGMLRRVAPSGHTEERPLRIERAEGALIADEPNETDLVNHAATVRQQGGKQYMRLGDHTQSWSACE